MSRRVQWSSTVGVLGILAISGADAPAPKPPVLAMAPIAAAPEIALAPRALLPTLRAGEELDYRARVWKGFQFLGAEVGGAKLTIAEERYEGRPSWRFEAQASGGAFGYDLDSDVTSYLARDDGEPLHYKYSQKGSDVTEKRLEFAPGKIEYWKRKHCDGKDCHDPDHFVADKHGRHHCDKDGDCDLPSHQVWRKRWEHVGQGSAYDVLSAVYLARSLDLTPGKVRTLRIVEGDQIFDVDIQATHEEWVRTDAGSFETVCIALNPRFVSGDPPKKKANFRGLFGLSGTIRIWIDKATRTPVRIRGTIPVGIDLNGQVDLVGRRSGR